MRGNMYVYGLGGAGINVVNDIKDVLPNLGDKFAHVELNLLDTTNKTIDNYPDLKDRFYKIESSKLGNVSIDGMAGERKNVEVVNEIKKSVINYINQHEDRHGINNYHILIFSGSGGSGNLIGTLMLKSMLEKDFNVIPVVIGDSSTLLNVTNTINTIAGLNNVAKQLNIALPIVYFDNSTDGICTPETEKLVNKNILKLLTIMSIYLSGHVHDIDHQDMNNFLLPSRYKTFTVQPGLYNLTVKTKSLVEPNVIIARTLRKESDMSLNIQVPLLHNKIGIPLAEHTKGIEDLLPMFLVIEKNTVNQYANRLKQRLRELESVKVVETEDIDSLEDVLGTDDGLVL